MRRLRKEYAENRTGLLWSFLAFVLNGLFFASEYVDGNDAWAFIHLVATVGMVHCMITFSRLMLWYRREMERRDV